jgi:type I restriction-modification system DNA methylase subunit
MNRDQARTLICQTFMQAFDKARFHNFANNLLNHIDESKASAWNSQYVKDAFKDHVSRYERLGTYTSPDNEKLDVLIVHLTREYKLERARTAIRNFVADHLKTRDEKDAALVAFVSPTEKQWRFSYVKMEYATVEKESGKVGVETRLTPARRFSYIVGEGESCHTAQTRFVGLLQGTETDPKLVAIEEAFSVEAVTKEFFNRYVDLFEDINKALDKLVNKEKTIGDEFKAKNVNTVDFAKKLMGQVVFLYFLQKKGWLGVAKGEDWGTGPHDFLRRLANGEYKQYENFFNDILEPLFYDTLATDRGHEAWCNHFKCRIPFLNGGLFEPLADYDWRKTDVILPNKLFTNSDHVDEGVIGTGVLDVFDRYNFTVNEAEPLEKEVAIDPEMLGKVFENLIEENRRKGLGAYYTPREIVHYMCQESLIHCIDTAVNTDKVSVSLPDIKTLVLLGEQISHYEAVDTKYPIKMPGSIEKHARLLDEKLAEITICDPAVGSGAFLVGMMTEIVRTRCALTPYFNDVHERTPYHFKRQAIQNCLYGVDIDAGAVEIAKLRLWLSLVVDEENVLQVKPLPNLDYKVIPGDSLLGIEEGALENWRAIHRLEILKPLFFDEVDKRKKDAYKREIDELIHQITHGNTIFDFNIYFSEVFHRKQGFDVLIANPPYIGESGHKDLFRKTKDGPLGKFYLGKMDYFYFFLHLALNLVRENGEVAFITTNYYLTATGAKKLRDDYKHRATVRSLISFNELRIFESAQGQHNMITLLKKGRNDKITARTCVTNRTGLATPLVLSKILLWDDAESNCFVVHQEDLYEGPENYIRLNRERGLVSSSPNINCILDSLAKGSELLGRIANIDQGVVSGCDYVSNRNIDKLSADAGVEYGDGIFVFDSENPRDKEVLSGFTEPERSLLKRFFKNSDIRRYWCSNHATKRLLYIGREIDSLRSFPNVAAHLKKFKSILSDRREVENGRIEYFQLQWPRTESIFTGEKIVVPYRSESNFFAYNCSEWFCRSDCYVITQKKAAFDLKYLLALLNSRLCFHWLYHRGKRKGEMLELFQVPLSGIPIKQTSKNDKEHFVSLVDKILASIKKLVVQIADFRFFPS